MLDFFLILVVATSLWVLFDARSIGVKKDVIPGFFNMGPVGWFFSCLLMWIIGFPAYIAKRGAYKQALSNHPASGSSDAIGTLQRLSELRDRGAISDEEYESKKRDLLGRI